MKTLNYTTDDNSMKFRIEFKRLNPYTYYPGFGKCWPITTQCLIFINERHVNTGECVKHRLDEDNVKLGAMIALKKAMLKVNLRCIRKDIWKLFHEIEWN